MLLPRSNFLWLNFQFNLKYKTVGHNSKPYFWMSKTMVTMVTILKLMIKWTRIVFKKETMLSPGSMNENKNTQSKYFLSSVKRTVRSGVRLSSFRFYKMITLLFLKEGTGFKKSKFQKNISVDLY